MLIVQGLLKKLNLFYFLTYSIVCIEKLCIEIIQKIEFDFPVEMFVLGYPDLKKLVSKDGCMSVASYSI